MNQLNIHGLDIMLTIRYMINKIINVWEVIKNSTKNSIKDQKIPSDLYRDFTLNNIKNNINKNDIKKLKELSNSKIPNNYVNIGIILSAGTSSRFNQMVSKQLFQLHDKEIVSYSIDIMIQRLDFVIIVTNSKCHNEMENIIKKYNNPKIKIIINDIDHRLESINAALNYMGDISNIKNVIIHDGARPHITGEYIEKLLHECDDDNVYSQYYLELVNGLIKRDNHGEQFDRSRFIELCTPVCINYEVLKFIFKNYINKENRITYEFIPILHILGMKYNLIEGHLKYLRKITTIDDIY